MLFSLNIVCLLLLTANSYNIMSNNRYTVDNKLSEFGVIIIKKVNLKLFKKFRLRSLGIIKRLGRQSELK